MNTFRLCLLTCLLGALPAVAAEPQIATFAVDGMSCMLCEAKVNKALKQTPGVIETKADRSHKQAEVKFDPDKVSAEALAAVITKTGFKAAVKSSRGSVANSPTR